MRKKTHIPIRLIVILGVVAITVVGILACSSSPSLKALQPDKLLSRYFGYIVGGQYEDMYGLLAEKSQSEITKDDFVARNKNIYEGIEAKNIAVTIRRVYKDTEKDKSGDIYKVEYSLSMDTAAGEIAYTNTAVFALNENNEYRMYWTTHTIFPNLDPNEKVQIDTLSAKRGTPALDCNNGRRRKIVVGATMWFQKSKPFLNRSRWI